MKNTETKRWQLFRKKYLPSEGMHIVRIENGAGPGTPDVNICCNAVETWIETKVATSTGRVSFRPFQIPWLENRWHTAQGSAWVLAFWGKEFYFVPGDEAYVMQEQGCKPFEPVPAERIVDVIRFGRNAI